MLGLLAVAACGPLLGLSDIRSGTESDGGGGLGPQTSTGSMPTAAGGMAGSSNVTGMSSTGGFGGGPGGPGTAGGGASFTAQELIDLYCGDWCAQQQGACNFNGCSTSCRDTFSTEPECLAVAVELLGCASGYMDCSVSPNCELEARRYAACVEHHVGCGTDVCAQNFVCTCGKACADYELSAACDVSIGCNCTATFDANQDFSASWSCTWPGTCSASDNCCDDTFMWPWP
jgi:hypothetical protein